MTPPLTVTTPSGALQVTYTGTDRDPHPKAWAHVRVVPVDQRGPAADVRAEQ